MDIFNHGLWGAVITYGKYPTDKKKIWAGVAFGMLPDALVFAPAFVWMALNRTVFDPSLYADLSRTPWVFGYAVNAYNITHSLVICTATLLIVTAIWKGKFYFPMLAWPLHVLFDIGTHPDFFSTPFLFPISDYKFKNGISWGEPIIFFSTYFFLGVIFIYFWHKNRRVKST